MFCKHCRERVSLLLYDAIEMWIKMRNSANKMLTAESSEFTFSELLLNILLAELMYPSLLLINPIAFANRYAC